MPLLKIARSYTVRINFTTYYQVRTRKSLQLEFSTTYHKAGGQVHSHHFTPQQQTQQSDASSHPILCLSFSLQSSFLYVTWQRILFLHWHFFLHLGTVKCNYYGHPVLVTTEMPSCWGLVSSFSDSSTGEFSSEILRMQWLLLRMHCPLGVSTM